MTNKSEMKSDELEYGLKLMSIFGAKKIFWSKISLMISKVSNYTSVEVFYSTKIKTN